MEAKIIGIISLYVPKISFTILSCLLSTKCFSNKVFTLFCLT